MTTDKTDEHVCMTVDEAVEWNNAQVKTPLSKNHWSVKAGKIRHVLRMGSAWKSLAKHRDHQLFVATVANKVLLKTIDSQDRTIRELQRLMILCDICGAPAGTGCSFHCSLDGNRNK